MVVFVLMAQIRSRFFWTIFVGIALRRFPSLRIHILLRGILLCVAKFFTWLITRLPRFPWFNFNSRWVVNLAIASL